MVRVICVIAFVLQMADVSGQRFMLSNLNSNVIYVGINNSLSLLVENTPCKLVVLKTDNGWIDTSYSSSCSFTIIPQKIGIANVQVFRKSGGKLQLIGSHAISVIAIPEPSPYVGNLRWGSVEKKSFLSMAGLIALGEEIHNYSTVESYTVTLFRDNQVLASINNTGYRFEEKTLQILRLMHGGDKVVISSIAVINMLGDSVQLRPIEYLILD